MAKNDEFLLGGVIDSYAFDGNTGLDTGEKFELLCTEQILKSYDLTNDEIKAGHTDGRLDGGLDSAYIFVNGSLYDHTRKMTYPKSEGVIEVILINCKHETSFREATLNTLIATSGELFDFSFDDLEISSRYNASVMQFRKNLRNLYHEMALYSPRIQFSVYCATRGDSRAVGDTILARARQLEEVISENFRDCVSACSFWGSSDILDAYRKVRSMRLEVPVVRELSEDGKCFVALCKIEDFYRFLCDESGNLRRYLMDANIRDYLGGNKVNSDIRATLREESDVDFWWLNNGVTILASSATIIACRLIARDIQIINGLQTSQTIYHHFSSGRHESSHKSILIKVIVSEDKALSDRIIVASNNQSPVVQSALRATDKTQRNIEDALEVSGWFYERRANYFKNIGRPENRIVSPMYLAAAYIAICMKNPASSANLKSKFMRSDKNYLRVFNPDFPVELWATLVELNKRSDEILLNFRKMKTFKSDRFLKTWRGVLSLLVVARIFGTFDFAPRDLGRVKFDASYRSILNDCWRFLEVFAVQGQKLTKPVLGEILDSFCAEFNILKKEAVGKQLPNVSAMHRVPSRIIHELDADFLTEVDVLLPPQPWPIGIHKDVAAKLGCSERKVSAAIQSLIDTGQRMSQRNGVVDPGDRG